jgi:hypothetical protein
MTKPLSAGSVEGTNVGDEASIAPVPHRERRFVVEQVHRPDGLGIRRLRLIAQRLADKLQTALALAARP